jgi:hypothetical protein
MMMIGRHRLVSVFNSKRSGYWPVVMAIASPPSGEQSDDSGVSSLHVAAIVARSQVTYIFRIYPGGPGSLGQILFNRPIVSVAIQTDGIVPVAVTFAAGASALHQSQAWPFAFLCDELDVDGDRVTGARDAILTVLGHSAGPLLVARRLLNHTPRRELEARMVRRRWHR